MAWKRIQYILPSSNWCSDIPSGNKIGHNLRSFKIMQVCQKTWEESLPRTDTYTVVFKGQWISGTTVLSGGRSAPLLVQHVHVQYTQN